VTDLRELVGSELGPSSWIEVTQERIDAFADATEDPQWIHVDAARAEEGPFGGTIAHGFLTLSLCVPMMDEVLPDDAAMSLNYGTNKVRFPAPVPSGSRVRGRFRVLDVANGLSGTRATIEAVVECDRSEKPVCVAELVVLSAS
jgi:acyl dehydratase